MKLLNENWEMARKRLEAFWEGKIIDRPCLQVFVVDETADEKIDEEPQRYWTDPATFFRIERERYLRKRYLGEAFPLLYPLCGGIPAILGAKHVYSPDTIWREPCATTLEEIDLSVFSLHHPVVQQMSAMVRYCAEQGAGECFVGFPPMGNSGDSLAKLRGYADFCADLCDKPETVIALDAQVTQIWKTLYDLLYGIINEHLEGSTGWLPAWHPRRSALIGFDFGGMISPNHFRRFLPHLLERANHVEQAIYHLDGPGALIHLDTLLSLPEFDAIQWEPGAGSGDILSWLPVMHRIQDAGKGLYVGYHGYEPGEAMVLLEELRPEGLIIPVKVRNENEGRKFLQQVRERF
ncbi:MAG: hypothetical protein L6435_18200 [Anaerolineae bacterium]|nr:hypothetical protein [Anaerolineae bacterium]